MCGESTVGGQGGLKESRSTGGHQMKDRYLQRVRHVRYIYRSSLFTGRHRSTKGSAIANDPNRYTTHRDETRKSTDLL